MKIWIALMYSADGAELESYAYLDKDQAERHVLNLQSANDTYDRMFTVVAVNVFLWHPQVELTLTEPVSQ